MTHDCCKTPPEHAEPIKAGHAHAHHAHDSHNASLGRLTTSATLHCLTGCAIGDFVGLAIGISLGLGPWATMALAVAFGFVSGFAFSLVPLLRSGLSLAQAWRAIWLGETISIAIMELAMNVADYHVGGVQVASMLHARFWLGYGAALVAGFAAAWPVNRWMLARAIKKPCH
ncbi:DUF4396 domain-containing protein [Luteimonas sp. SX5]|uniref:DUF4396 domain-containing protein n=1 Tax=Luteimonas galliterrae TaxID=2940486 RepID=A0ABT0MMM8_9GAMM|nr:DUF4396 domain-containing protein [Luteimonas galliterrae]MCL1636135.1 DUF4396 domain-containing protein [Luteimonas galliterrae]